MKLPKSTVWNSLNIALLIIAVIQYYLLTPLNAPVETFMNTLLDFDYRFKLIPAFLFPYFSVYIFFLLILFLVMKTKDSFKLTIFLLSVVFLWSIVNLGHGFFHTYNFLRPEIKETSVFFSLVKDLYNSVKPNRTLPSWHAATAVLCVIAYFKLSKKKRIPMVIWCVLICLSPLFLKMAYVIDVVIAVPFAFVSYSFIEKITTVKMKTERVQEIVKTFSLESLIQSVAIGIRDESTLSSLIESLTRIEKNLSEEDREELKQAGSECHPPVESLKDAINNMILSINVTRHIEKAKEMFGKGEKTFTPTDKELKLATEELVSAACTPFDNPKFRFAILEIKKRNAQIININSIEEAAKERSHDIIYRFNSFIESHKKDIPALGAITSSTNGHHTLSFEDIKHISRELRKPPYEISPDEIWTAFYRIDNTKVKPLGDQKNPANIISLTQYALGKIDRLEPYGEMVDRKFNTWIEQNKNDGRNFTTDELEWLTMMKNHFASFLEVNMTSFNQPPFVNRGGASKAYNIFGHDLNRILFELNEKLL